MKGIPLGEVDWSSARRVPRHAERPWEDGLTAQYAAWVSVAFEPSPTPRVGSAAATVLGAAGSKPDLVGTSQSHVTP